MKLCFPVGGNLRFCQLCDDSWIHGSFKATWSGELSDKYTAAVYMSFATIEREIVDINVRLNQVVRERFSKHNFHLGNHFKTGLSFVGLTWLVIDNSEDF